MIAVWVALAAFSAVISALVIYAFLRDEPSESPAAQDVDVLAAEEIAEAEWRSL